jgi:hypothetical protein
VRIAIVLLVGCSASTVPAPASSTTPPSAGQPLHTQTLHAQARHGCADAALGLEAATKGVRSPDRSVFEQLKLRCERDAWSAATTDCFATMREGDLGECSRALPERSREKLFSVLAGSEPSRAGIAVARARLDQVSVGVAACDRFVTAVSTMLACEHMPIDARVELGTQTADMWALPVHRLAAADLQRIASVCGESLTSLEQQVVALGCTP